MLARTPGHVRLVTPTATMLARTPRPRRSDEVGRTLPFRFTEIVLTRIYEVYSVWERTQPSESQTKHC